MKIKLAIKKKQLGFTLVEILIVMVIIGIIATIGLGSFASSQMKGRDASRKSDLTQIGRALETYYNDHGQYPFGSNGAIAGCGAGLACGWGEPFIDDKNTIYMIKLPQDPKSNRYYYYSSDDGSSYQIYASLENRLDASTVDFGTEPGQFDGLNCGADDFCNYGIASPNTTPEEGRSIIAL